MKKFEEEIDKNIESIALRQNGESVITVCDYNRVRALGHGWVSPEDHQNTVASNKAYEKSNRTLSEENAKFVVENIELQKQIAELKSQLKKQKPEIPEFMAKAVEEFKKQPDSYKGFSNVNEVWSWLNEYQMNNDDFGICGLNNKFFVLAHFAINGYTVAKEKRFYLKHKSVLIFDPDSDDSDVDELYLGAGGNFVPYQHLAKIFTQSQIDSMETGSYEQIEVTE